MFNNLKGWFNARKNPEPLRCEVCGAKLKVVYTNPISGGPRCGYDVDYWYEKRMGLSRTQYIEQYGNRDLILPLYPSRVLT